MTTERNVRRKIKMATILGALRTDGGRVHQDLGAEVHLIKMPITAKVFPMMMVLAAALIVGIVEATMAYGYWNNSIAPCSIRTQKAVPYWVPWQPSTASRCGWSP